MAGNLRDTRGKWRESRRQYQIERALYKINGGKTGPFASDNRVYENQAHHLTAAPEAPKGKAPPTAE